MFTYDWEYKHDVLLIKNIFKNMGDNLQTNTRTECQRQKHLMTNHACLHNACTFSMGQCEYLFTIYQQNISDSKPD